MSTQDETKEIIETTATAETIEAVQETVNTAEEAAVEAPQAAAEAAEAPQAVAAPEAPAEEIPSMDDFKDEISQSFKKLQPGDLINGTVIGVSDSEVTVDLGSYAEGMIKLSELSNDPRFSIKADIAVGDPVCAVVLREDKEGNILLSRKQADDIVAWKKLKELLDNRTTVSVKIAQTVNKGVVTYLEGIRAFIPASQLALSFVEDLETFVGQTVDAIVITADEENKKLVLSAKEPAREKAAQDKLDRLTNVSIGSIVEGTVEKLMPFGAFVSIGDGLSGLVHISQISQKRIASAAEVLKVGQTVRVKILELKEGKLRLSIKATEESTSDGNERPARQRREGGGRRDNNRSENSGPSNYKDGGEATTGLGSLLANIKL